MDSEALRASWTGAWRELGIAAPDALLAELQSRHGEPQRHYHTLQHLGECLGLLEAHRAAAERPAEVALALWFHDAIYDVHGHDNEARSADWGRDALVAAGAPAEVARRVHGLVMATQHSALPEGRDAELLVDIDLAILGAAPQRFAQYEQQIRAEYAHVPPVLFEARRRAILSRFLEREPLYRTAAIRAEREQRARINLRVAIGPAGAPSVEELLALAIQRVNGGDPAQARALCDLALAAHPPHPAVFQLLAHLLLQEGDLPQAGERAAQSLALRPGHAPTLRLAEDIAHAAFERALKLQDAGDLKGAAEALRLALRLLPTYAQAAVNLGIVLQEDGDLEGAMSAYGRAYRLREDSFGRIAHALAAASTGRIWLELDDLREALRTAPAF